MYPIRYEADYVEERDRLTAFFRYLLAIPWAIVASIYGLAAYVVAVIAWFAIVFTARYPTGLYNFNAGFLRFLARVYGWLSLQTDAWPPFGMGAEPGYPIRLEVAPPRERYSRAKAFFRLILAIPLFFVQYFVNFMHVGAAAVSWLQIVFVGRQSPGLQNVLSLTSAWNIRFNAYAWLLITEDYPPVSEQAAAGALPAAATPAAIPKATTAS